MLSNLDRARIWDVQVEIDRLEQFDLPKGSLSDGYHTFDELYFHRMVLSSIIFNSHKDVAWKSKQHHDGTMFGENNFIVGVETPQGQYSYHYDLEFWDLFDVPEVEFAPEYDGHTPSDIGRLFSL